MRILAIDPGQETGWALFDPEGSYKPTAAARLNATKATNGQLLACGLSSPRTVAEAVDGLLAPANGIGEGWSERIDEVHAERPKHYPNSKVSATDIVTLALRCGESVGAYSARGAKVTYYEPAEWKGQVAKNPHHQRIWARLTDSEKDIVEKAARKVPEKKRNNVLDAVALGLFALGRVRVGGV